MTPQDSPHYVVGVRALCEFAAKRGDLDLRFTPSPSAQEGQAGHRVVAARGGDVYEAELSLTADYKTLTVRGRADGYDAAAQRLDEVKTHRGDLALQPANHRHLHWSQARVYGALLCQARDLKSIELQLVYFHVGDETETCFAARHTAAELQQHFSAICEAFLAWSEQERRHARQRDPSLAALRFVHPTFRQGQRQLAEAVYRHASQARCLIAQAPTGIGKTLATVFPLLKAWPTQKLDKIFFLTAKGSGRRTGLQALATLQSAGAHIRTLELTARDKACEHPDKACHGESCPLAQGFYDRLPAARQAALAEPELLDQATLRRHALAHAVCPYHFAHELVRWADVVVADYNHFFDLHALLHTLTVAHEWRVAVLVDEAHNLLPRARDMYSAALDRTALKQAQRDATPALAASLKALARQWRQVTRGQEAPYETQPSVPAGWLRALQQVATAMGEQLADQPLSVAPTLRDFYFDTLHFLRIHERWDSHTLFDICLEPTTSTPHTPRARQTPNSILSLRNVIPARHLQPRFASAATTVLFSATLTPMPFYRDTLGLPADSAGLDVAAPFAAEQLQVRVQRGISTRYRDRERSLAAVSALMAQQLFDAPGNYLAFFSSFEYLEQAAADLAQRHPQVPIWLQTRGMSAPNRDAFLHRFHEDGCGIGFAVLGGVFGEGIDLPGRRLIGAFIATLGLPPVNAVNENFRERLDAAFGAGYDYTYLYPGIQKVVQAAGRVIRSLDDRGVVCLMDDRFAQPQVRKLLPAWWRVTVETRKAQREEVLPELSSRRKPGSRGGPETVDAPQRRRPGPVGAAAGSRLSPGRQAKG